MVKFTIPGIPIAKARPRMTKQGHAFTPSKTVNYENLVQYTYMDQMEGVKLEGPLEIGIKLYFPIPKSYTKKQREDISTGKLKYIKKPDVDNCIKSITDALNGFAYDDDSQIIGIIAQKHYTDEEPRAEVMIQEVE